MAKKKAASRKKSARAPAPRRRVAKKPARAMNKKPSAKTLGAKPHSFVSTFLWLVLIDGFLSLLRLLTATFFIAGPALTSLDTVVGIYGIFVFLLSIVVAFIFLRQKQPARLMAVPIYVIVIPLVLFGLASLSAVPEGQSVTLIVLTWVAVLGEIAIAASQLTEKLRGW